MSSPASEAPSRKNLSDFRKQTQESLKMYTRELQKLGMSAEKTKFSILRSIEETRVKFTSDMIRLFESAITQSELATCGIVLEDDCVVIRSAMPFTRSNIPSIFIACGMLYFILSKAIAKTTADKRGAACQESACKVTPTGVAHQDMRQIANA
jgi:hypothetical protein